MASVPTPQDIKTNDGILTAFSEKVQNEIENVPADVCNFDTYRKLGGAGSTSEEASQTITPRTAIPPGWARMSEPGIDWKTGAHTIFVNTALILAWAGDGASAVVMATSYSSYTAAASGLCKSPIPLSLMF